MKRAIIIGVVVALLVGGGATFYFLNGGSESKTKTAGGGQLAAASGGDQRATVSDDDRIFLEIENLAIPIIRDRRVERHVLLRVMLEMVDEESRNKAYSQMPRLKDAFIKDLYDYFAYQAPGREGINVEIIKKRLKRAATRAMGEGKIRQVLIQTVLERGSRSK